MAIQASKPNSRIFLLLGVVLAVLAFGGVLFALNQNSGGGSVSVVVAKNAIPANTTITADMVTSSSVPKSVAPTDAFTDATKVVGQTTTLAVAQNTALVPAFFNQPSLAASTTATTTGAPVDVETQIAKGFVAIAIPAAPPSPPTADHGYSPNTVGLSADEASAGFYIQAGDHIDILIDPGTNGGGIRFAFQDLLVLRAGVAGTAANGAAVVYLVEVPRSQAELLTSLVTVRGVTKQADGRTLNPGPFVVKYVLRPQSEWGKTLPNGAGYTPNYENTTGPGIPPVHDNTVTLDTLQGLFNH